SGAGEYHKCTDGDELKDDSRDGCALKIFDDPIRARTVALMIFVKRDRATGGQQIDGEANIVGHADPTVRDDERIGEVDDGAGAVGHLGEDDTVRRAEMEDRPGKVIAG